MCEEQARLRNTASNTSRVPPLLSVSLGRASLFRLRRIESADGILWFERSTTSASVDEHEEIRKPGRGSYVPEAKRRKIRAAKKQDLADGFDIW